MSINTDNPYTDFSALESGEKALEDMAPQYYDRNRARRYMGLEGEERDENA